ncbi:MAG: biotin/lipoyl-binding protein, partial [Bacteroidales bacterium]|nr:biotin/lipoyl-binding protein [Bacteroidales bacterium]
MKKLLNIALIAFVATGIASCGGKKEEKSTTTVEKQIENVKVQTLQKERIAKHLEVAATLEGYEKMNVSPSITGHIEHIYVEVGSRVSKGDMLVRMDQTQLNTTRI